VIAQLVGGGVVRGHRGELAPHRVRVPDGLPRQLDRPLLLEELLAQAVDRGVRLPMARSIAVSPVTPGNSGLTSATATVSPVFTT
jgi:hypothetical protein